MSKIEKVEKYIKSGKVHKLVALTKDKDKEVCLAAIRGLGKLAENEDALNTLVNMEEDSDADIREAVVTALGDATGSYVETQLSYCLGHEKDPKVLEAARNSLKKIRGEK